VLDASEFRHYPEGFNAADEELYPQHIPNADAWDWMRRNVPLFECPDKEIEQTYFFRWWTYRKHIRMTPEGFVITEFLPNVPWAGKHNTISCPAGHHFYEGRWIADPRYPRVFAKFWFSKRRAKTYSFCADACFHSILSSDLPLLAQSFPAKRAKLRAWKKSVATHRLFWQLMIARHGISIAEAGYRATD